MPLTRRSCPGPSGERTNTTITPVWPCEPLFAPIMGGAVSLPLPADTSRIGAAVLPLWREDLPPPGLFTEDEKKSRIKAGVASGAPGQSHRPAVRVGATGCGNFGVAQKWGQNREGDITFAVNIPEALLSQGKNRGQSGNLPGFCSDAGLLIPPIPPQKLRRNETKKRRFRNAAN